MAQKSALEQGGKVPMAGSHTGAVADDVCQEPWPVESS
jgi:hypothetical protein